MHSIVEKTMAFVKNQLQNAEAGHDWWHIKRVVHNAKLILLHEKANEEVVLLGALLHDIADSKFYNGDETLGPQLAKNFLAENNVNEETIYQVLYIIENISYKGGPNPIQNPTIELKIVQDADRLDAIGAMGIARTFHYGGFKNNLIYDPNIPPKLNMDKETYKNHKGTTINHFYEKLLLLKDLMNTETGRKLAEERHAFMLSFLNQFYKEWPYMD